jgi:hypothetical protein
LASINCLLLFSCKYFWLLAFLVFCNLDLIIFMNNIYISLTL